jgi:hypothetical protein
MVRMIGTFTSPVLLCNTCLANAGITQALVVGGFQSTSISMLPTSTQADVNALTTFLAVAAPCPHKVPVTSAQQQASDDWLTATALLAALPAAPAPPAVDPYAAIRARYTSSVASALVRANNAGGLA